METTASTTPAQHPVRLVVNDDLQRTRLTVLFRLILAIPHLVWASLWAVIATLAWLVNWFATLFMGQLGTYPIDLEIDPPQRQNRWTVFFRGILALPALLLTNILSNLSQLLAIFSWFIALVTGRVPEGLRNFAALAMRFETQTYAYLLLLTGRYPSFNVGVEA